MLQYKTGEDFYNKIYLHFNALIAVSLIPFGVLLLDLQKSPPQQAMLTGIPGYVALILLALTGAFMIYWALKQYKARALKTDLSLRDKLNTHYAHAIKKYIQITIGCLCFVLALWLTRDKIVIPGYIVGLVILSLGRPTLQDIIRQLKLSSDEESILYEKKEIAQLPLYTRRSRD